MHIAKFKSQDVVRLVSHYERRHAPNSTNENIDFSRSNLNYTLKNSSESLDSAINRVVKSIEQDSGRKVRKDAVLMADIVLTLPPNIRQEDLKKFFFNSANFLKEKLMKNGLEVSEGLYNAYIHLDETTPHMHLAFAPVTRNSAGQLTFSFKKVCDRMFYKTMHEELEEHLTQVLGYKPAILREDEDKLKSLSKLDQKTYKATINQMRAEKGELLDAKKVLDGRFEELKATVNEQRVNCANLESERASLDGKLMIAQMNCNKLNSVISACSEMSLEDCKSELEFFERELNLLESNQSA